MEGDGGGERAPAGGGGGAVGCRKRPASGVLQRDASREPACAGGGAGGRRDSAEARQALNVSCDVRWLGGGGAVAVGG